MLEPLTGKPREHKFTTYDLEWWPETYELRLVGVYDKEKGYRHYSSIEQFFLKELTGKNCHRRFYAHFGGSSDIIFLINYIMRSRTDLRIDAIFAGSSAVIVRVSDINNRKRNWTFVDSGYLIRRPLADIGGWLGNAKGDKAAIYSENLQELIDYNEKDCRILYEAVQKLQWQLNAFGGELKSTLASSALDLFRRRFLKHQIRTRKDVNAFARRAFIASRVEVFRRECEVGEYFDINSSFPTSMSRPQPGNVIAQTRRLPSSGCYLADVEVRVKDCYLPPIGYRHDDGRILFPVGSWRSVLDSADVELLERTGHEVTKVHECLSFEPFSDLAEYVAIIYALKEKATGYEREVWKLLLNSLYGKFGERSDKRKILFRPLSIICQHTIPCPDDNPCIERIADDIYSVKEDKEIPHAHVPIAAHITALSRGLLYDHLDSCRKVFYCDTDSIVCGPEDVLPTGTTLGALKHEYSVRMGTFLAPKLYSFERDDGKRIVRAKGFSRLDYQGFQALAEGREYVISRMQRIRESLNFSGTVTPKDIRIEKRIYLQNTKRRFLPSGDSVPWTLDELAA